MISSHPTREWRARQSLALLLGQAAFLAVVLALVLGSWALAGLAS